MEQCVDTQKVCHLNTTHPNVSVESIKHYSMGVVRVRVEKGAMYINDRKVVEHSPDHPCQNGTPLPPNLLFFLLKEQKSADIALFLQNLKANAYGFFGTTYHGHNDWAYFLQKRGDGYWFPGAIKGIDLDKRSRFFALVVELAPAESVATESPKS